MILSIKWYSSRSCFVRLSDIMYNSCCFVMSEHVHLLLSRPPPSRSRRRSSPHPQSLLWYSSSNGGASMNTAPQSLSLHWPRLPRQWPASLASSFSAATCVTCARRSATSAPTCSPCARTYTLTSSWSRARSQKSKSRPAQERKTTCSLGY